MSRTRKRADDAPAKARYVGALGTVEQIRREAARVYREVRQLRGDAITVDEAYKLVMVLQVITKLIEATDLERRIAALETAAAGVTPIGARRRRA